MVIGGAGMTIILHNGQQAFHFTHERWAKLLALGEVHGWNPAGTQTPP
jgi:hypothetical protein